jgi:YD repeat-containing protein
MHSNRGKFGESHLDHKLMKHNIASAIVIALAAIFSAPQTAQGAAGTETYEYDARGRLIKVTYPGGATAKYNYDPAGNRTSTGPDTAASATGTFALTATAHSSRGSAGNIATATIKNTGTATITAITYSCAGGSWYKIGTPPTTLAAGASATFQCQAAANGSYSVVMVWTGSTASNSPFSPGSW